MNAFKSFPEISAVMIGDVPRLIDSKGNDITLTMEGCERLAACWNACRKLYAPAGHIEAIGERVERLERLRKDAWARAEQLQGQIDAIQVEDAA